MLEAQTVLSLLVVVGFLLALARFHPGWAMAAIGVVGNPIKPAFVGQWARLVNPVHALAGGLWIGTLFVLVVAGFGVVIGSGLAPPRRAAIVAQMVNAFSPLALCSAALLAVMGVITAWRHLKYVAAIWITPYGITLVVKLLAVTVVLGLGAFNWRKQKGKLGTLDGAMALRGSANHELFAAAVVLAITAILVSLPSPKLPG